MARIRSIKPEFFTDSDIAQLAPLTRLFFVGLWCQCDKAGRCKYKPDELGARILPYTKAGGKEAIDELVEAKFVIRYEIDGVTYLQVRTWDRHQRPHHTEASSVLPPFHNRATTVRQRTEGKGREGKGKEGKGKEGSAPPSAADDLRDWMNWWNGLYRDKLVSGAVRIEKPSQGVVAGWRRVQKSSELRELLGQRESIRKEISGSSFCRKPWFRLEKLLGGKNQDGELIAQKLLDGGFRDEEREKPTDLIPEDPAAEVRKEVAEQRAAAAADPLKPMSDVIKEVLK